VQRPVVGAVGTVVLLAGPQTPSLLVMPLDDPDELLGGLASVAWQAAIVPPFEPAQVQLNGPVPLTADAVPVLQRAVVGAGFPVSLLAAPHAPLTAAGFSDAAQLAVVPPFEPPQVQLNGPVPLIPLPDIVEAVPVEQRLPVGGLLMLCPLDEPHVPLSVTITRLLDPELLEPLLDPPDELPATVPPELDPASFVDFEQGIARTHNCAGEASKT
jgi:hypothetical protein